MGYFVVCDCCTLISVHFVSCFWMVRCLVFGFVGYLFYCLLVFWLVIDWFAFLFGCLIFITFNSVACL